MAEIIITLENEEKHYDFERLSVDFNSSDSEILSAVAPVVLEETGFDMDEDNEDNYFTVKRVDSSQNIYLFPKSVAGSQKQ